MTVADLLDMLRQHDPRARVLLWDRSASTQPAVASLGYGEVQSVQLGAWESSGLRVLEVWDPADMRLEGPFAGVVLGSQF